MLFEDICHGFFREDALPFVQLTACQNTEGISDTDLSHPLASFFLDPGS